MKHILLLFIVLAFAGCTDNDIEVTGFADGVTDGTVILKDASRETLKGVNLKDGKFNISKTHLESPGYGTLTFSEPGKRDLDFELYLEPGAYAIKFDKSTLGAYPQVTSKSAIQNQLSAYYKLLGDVSKKASQKVKELDEKYQQASKSPVWDDSTTALLNQLEHEKTMLNTIGCKGLMAYITANPQNEIAAHIMQGMNIDDDPVAYNAVYQKFSQAQKDTEEGKDIGKRLKIIVRLTPGEIAPPIAGIMPDSKSFDLKAMHKKLVLVEFWRASSEISRINHQKMINNPPPFMRNKDLGIVSVSFDKKRDWWLGSMRDDKVTWPQVSDLKGNDSPNKSNWAVTTIPTYYLLDGAGHIVDRDLQFSEIDLVVDRYFKHINQ